jgi:hypothetical protein
MPSPPADNQLPPPLPGEEAAARRAENPIVAPDGTEPSQGRRALGPVLIGVVAKLLVALAIPLVIVVVLAFLAQHAIGGH